MKKVSPMMREHKKQLQHATGSTVALSLLISALAEPDLQFQKSLTCDGASSAAIWANTSLFTSIFSSDLVRNNILSCTLAHIFQTATLIKH